MNLPKPAGAAITTDAAGAAAHGHPARAWLALCALAALGALAMTFAEGARWDWQPQHAWDEPWRMLSAAWVHLSPRHLAANLAGTAALAALGAAARCGPRAALAWALAWPLTQLGLLVEPRLAHYAGLSGVLHAAVVVVAVQLLLHAQGRRRAVGAALLLGTLVKLVGETPWATPVRLSSGWDMPVATLAHASGALAGALCGVVLLWPRRPARLI